MNENETYNNNDAIQAIIEIAEIEHINNESLACIESSLEDINNHIAEIDEYLVITNKEVDKANEQKSEEDNKEEEQKNRTDTEETEESITIDNVYTEIQTVNENLETQNNLLIVNVFTSSILVGTILFVVFWNRVFK